MNARFHGWGRKAGCVAICFAIAVVAGSIGGAYRKWAYPYGWSHCCITQIRNALEDYAESNGGKYPAGEVCPEASLMLLYGDNGIDANTLRGMTVPEETVQSLITNGQKLGPDSCGWKYAPGLTLADNPSLALLWCKMPLTHNGARSSDGGRQVVFVGGSIDWVSGDKWPGFLSEQNELMKRRSLREIEGTPLVTGVIELPDGNRIERVDGSYTLEEDFKGPNTLRSGTKSGRGLTLSHLSWYRAPLQDGSVTRTLSFDDLVSAPVTITFDESVPDVTNVVFRMTARE